MVSRFLVPVVAAVLLTVSMAQAQVAQLGAPANYPPASFTGQQFVDNDGCVYLRAGFGGTVNWVPRVNASHRPLCNYPPTFGPAVAAALAADMAPEPLVMTPPAAPRPLFAKPYVGNPIPLVPMAPALQVIAAPAPQPLVPAQPAYRATVTSGQAQCFTNSPRLETVLLRSGGTALVCTRGDGTLTGWRSPLFAKGVIGGALTPRMMQGATLTTAYAAPVQTTPLQSANTIPKPPKGYRLAWRDDRLNPLRGLGTAAGQAQQDQIWTRTIPAKLIPQVQVQQSNTSVSTMSAPTARALYVQVGTFGQPTNAAGAKARLTALGLPVATSSITRMGQVLQVVYAGPFDSPTQAQSALATTLGAGFTDAMLK